MERSSDILRRRLSSSGGLDDDANSQFDEIACCHGFQVFVDRHFRKIFGVSDSILHELLPRNISRTVTVLRISVALIDVCPLR